MQTQSQSPSPQSPPPQSLPPPATSTSSALVFGSLSNWIAGSVILASFAPLINNAHQEPKLATFMIVIGAVMLILMTCLYIESAKRTAILNGDGDTMIWTVTLIVGMLLIAYLWMAL